MRRCVEVPDLQFAEQTDAHHLDAREDKHAGDDEDRAVYQSITCWPVKTFSTSKPKREGGA